MKGKALMLISTMIVSASVAAVVALGTAAQAALRPASAHATHRAALVTTTIQVRTQNSSFNFSPPTRTAPRGIVIFKVTNPHATNTAGYRHDFSINGHTTPLLSVGQSATLRVTFLRPGRYPYKDTIDHHAQIGMKGFFTIT
jgi:uncharacterized cupredoxin-like copper-binding protein